MLSKSEGGTICTVVTRNYLHYAMALVRSVRKYHTDLPIVICVVDRPERLPELGDPYAEFVFADELNVPRWPKFSFQYSPSELACALKPIVMRYSLSLARAPCVIYLDADMQLYAALHGWFAATRDANIVLTPHLLRPVPEDGKTPSRTMFALAGTYNGGFVAVNRSSAAGAFIDWWQSILSNDCIVNLPAGYFVDQKPLDLVPGLFDGVRIFREPGFHVAYWNLFGERLFPEGDGYRLRNGNRLVLFHFSGLDLNNPGTLSRYQNRIDLGEFPVLRELIDRYVARLDQCGRREYETLSYGYATLSDGTVIPDAWREVIRTDHPAFRDVEDPFDTARYPDLPQRFESTRKSEAAPNETEAAPSETKAAPSETEAVLPFSKRLGARCRQLLGRGRRVA